MTEVEFEATGEEDRQAKDLLGQLLSFSSHDVAIAFLHRHCHQITPLLVELLKDQVVYYVRVDVDQALAIADLTREAARVIGDPRSEALSSHALAVALDCSGQYLKALEHYDRAEAIYERLGEDVQAARIGRAKVKVLLYLGRYDEALASAERARQIFEAHGELGLAAQVDANVGGLYERLAQYHTALTYYQRAADVFSQLDDRKSLAVVQTNLALVYSYLNEFEPSLALYEQARAIYQELGLHLWAIQVDHNVAWLYFLRGRFDHALKQFNWVELEALKHGDVTQAAICKLDLAEVYLQLNAFEDALEASQSAIQQFTGLQMISELAKAKMYQGMAHLHLGAFDQAATLLQDARTLFTQEGNEIYQALCDLYLSEVTVKQEKWDRAQMLCQAASQIFESNRLDSKAAYAQFQLARIQLHAGDLLAARSLCDRAIQYCETLDAPWLKYQCFHLKGNLDERFGDPAEAYQNYKQALKHIEEMRSTIRVDEFKATFVKDKLKVYEDLVRLCLEDGSREKKQEAFRFVEAAKSRALVDLLSSTLRMKGKDGTKADPDLIQRWNTLREELDWYYNKFNEYESKSAPRPAEIGQDLRMKIREREAELAKLLRQLQIKDPKYFSVQGVSQITSAEVAGELADDEVLLEYYTTGDEIHVFVIDSSGLQVAQPLSPASPILGLLRKLRFQLNKHLLEADYVRRHEAALRQFVDEHLEALYERLIEPIAATLQEKRLVIVPHGFLHYIPFHALFDGQEYVIDGHEISYCPSAQAFRLCRQRGQEMKNGRTPALIVGVPDEGLPHIAQEVTHLQSLIPGSETLLGEEANLEQFKRRAEHCRFLHLASHAVFRQDNPLFSALKLANSWLNFYDIFHLELQAKLVTLSACQTGMSKVFAGDELVGLMRGFLYAGAPSLILSLWAVNDRSTAELMGALYSRLIQGQPVRSALREAQLAIRERYSHPYFWAPFVLMGQP
ncbi:MAG: CHAT domain-containing protein [Acidobacteria bacterium]|nr:CHAT domain-containing protein [Acidobacteriota bacterium]